MNISSLKKEKIQNWQDISIVLNSLSENSEYDFKCDNIKDLISCGIAFITYNYGVDGVSIEISKYARCFESMHAKTPVHLIGGGFLENADAVIKDRWQRFEISEFDGWDKWENGKWFKKLFYEDLLSGSAESDDTACQIWTQAVAHAEKISEYITANNIKLIIPVNISSNPGNLSTSLAVVLASEITGAYVLNSNHDFYWEGGKPACEKKDNEPPGCRDHFFRNIDNKAFFKVFQSILPWNGKRWFQININKRQSIHLEKKYGFSDNRVAELSTAIPDNFFETCSVKERQDKRQSMSYIFSDGHPVISPVQIDKHLSGINEWMENQKPVVCSCCENQKLDIVNNPAIYFLQPTRIIARKRIPRNFKLLAALLDYPEFMENFNSGKNINIILHITGPIPKEHQADLEEVLKAYKTLLSNSPSGIADRLFLAFSVGNENHPALQAAGLKGLHIWDFYKIADMVLFPSEEEGRGLPLIESAASGVPIISSRYHPEEVFKEVVGENLPEEQRIKYIHFPEKGFDEKTLAEVTSLIFNKHTKEILAEHNRKAVLIRYSVKILKDNFTSILKEITKP